MYEDKVIKCKDCGNEFVFSAGEQEFYASKGFTNEPTRCRDCRAVRRAQSGEGQPQREMYDAVCAECGKETKVPFRPRNDRPIYCYDCFQKQRQGQ